MSIFSCRVEAFHKGRAVTRSPTLTRRASAALIPSSLMPIRGSQLGASGLKPLDLSGQHARPKPSDTLAEQRLTLLNCGHEVGVGDLIDGREGFHSVADQHSQGLRRVAIDSHARRHVAHDDRARADAGIVANRDAGDDPSAGAEENPIPDGDVPAQVHVRRDCAE